MLYLQFGYVTALCFTSCYSLIILILRGSNCRNFAASHNLTFVNKELNKTDQGAYAHGQTNTDMYAYTMT
jgi:hypothetical protein